LPGPKNGEKIEPKTGIFRRPRPEPKAVKIILLTAFFLFGVNVSDCGPYLDGQPSGLGVDYCYISVRQPYQKNPLIVLYYDIYTLIYVQE
jgi:hypothetical protein